MRQLKTEDRWLTWEDGAPFFYLGDTAWEIFHRLNREEAEHYFSVRALQGFTAIQAVLLAEFEGLTVPNAYGRLPFHFTNGLPDPLKPDLDGEYPYWHHVDFMVKATARHGLFLTLLPTWGDKINLCWGQGPVVFNEDNACRYGRWLGDRYKDEWNIIWMLGGDRPLEPAHRAVVDAMARGIRQADASHLITFHPPGTRNSTDFVGDAPYIDFHTSQTGHGVEQCYQSDAVMARMAEATKKPYLDSEPRYEDHPACFNDQIGYYWQARDIRQNAYWNVLAGACGHTYGNHCIWSMNRKASSYFPYTWQEALTHEGAKQIGYVKELRLRREYFSLRPAPELIKRNYPGMGHLASAMGDGYAYVYSPLGTAFTVNLDPFFGAKQLRALWFDPRTGRETLFAVLPAQGETLLAPPTQGVGCDWLLVLEVIA